MVTGGEGPGDAVGGNDAPTEQDAYVEAVATQADLLNLLRERTLQRGAKLDVAALASSPRWGPLLRELEVREGARAAKDFANLCRYRSENASERAKGHARAVFIGDSITEYWRDGDPSLFVDRIVNRGIGGQTTSQVVLRFYSDVAELRPAVVHIMAGTNDVACNTGPIGDVDILHNFRAMIDVAQANEIEVVLASIPPMERPVWNARITDAAQRIVRLNVALRDLAASRRAIFVDYHAVLRTAHDTMRPDLSNDGVHPHRDGYKQMRLLTLRALEQARQ